MNDMRLGDLDALAENLTMLAKYEDGFRANVILGVVSTVRNTKAIDAVPVCRCKDCKWYGANPYDWENEDEMFCKYWIDYLPTNADDFCSYGERKEADGNG